ncbi:hypothetical protein [uncultured Sulfitobacter sp.]|uniref:hypothetical protein n=1 Tax=uncultured Sulfitobacter sp. TaxID=191468 RepID=UPI0026016864|nr:hypothetical protein [uncultured Sulfitobacter sp.]
MRNDNDNWDMFDIGGPLVTASGITIQSRAIARQTVISGAGVLRAFEKSCGPAIGWPDVAQGASYAVALRRDRVLLVNGPALQEGWDDTTGHAVSDMTGGYAVIELSGVGVQDVLKRGAEINPDLPSRSAARRFGELGVILYHFENANCVRLHVNVAQQQAAWLMLQTYADQMFGP